MTRPTKTMTFMIGLFASGCGQAPNDLPKRYPCGGKVLIDDVPAVRAAVTFHPVNPHSDGKRYVSSTFTDDNGEFQLTTIEAGDGAPVGDYVVTVVATFISKQGQDVSVPDLLRGRYADPKTSRLKVTIRDHENRLDPFALSARDAK